MLRAVVRSHGSQCRGVVYPLSQQHVDGQPGLARLQDIRHILEDLPDALGKWDGADRHGDGPVGLQGSHGPHLHPRELSECRQDFGECGMLDLGAEQCVFVVQLDGSSSARKVDRPHRAQGQQQDACREQRQRPPHPMMSVIHDLRVPYLRHVLLRWERTACRFPRGRGLPRDAPPACISPGGVPDSR